MYRDGTARGGGVALDSRNLSLDDEALFGHGRNESRDEVGSAHGILERVDINAIDRVDAERHVNPAGEGAPCARVLDAPSVIADLDNNDVLALESREALVLQHLGDRDLERFHNVEGEKLLGLNAELHDCFDHRSDERHIRLHVLRAEDRIQRHLPRLKQCHGDAEPVTLGRHRRLEGHARLVVCAAFRNVRDLKLREAEGDVRVFLETRAHGAPLETLDGHAVADELTDSLTIRVRHHLVLLALVLQPPKAPARKAAHRVLVGGQARGPGVGEGEGVLGGAGPEGGGDEGHGGGAALGFLGEAQALRRGGKHRDKRVHLILLAVAGLGKRGVVRDRGPHRAFDHLAGSDVLPGGGLGDFRDVNLFFDCGAVLSVGSVGAVLAARARERLEHLKHRLSHAEGFIDVGAPQDGVDCVIHEQLDRAPREEDTPLVARGHLTQLPLARHHGAGRPHSRPPIEDVAPLIVFDRAFLLVFAGRLRDGGDVVVRRVEAPLPSGALRQSFCARNARAMLGRALCRRQLFPDAGVVPDPFSLRVRTRLPVRATPLGAVDPGHTALGLRHALPQLVRPVVASPASLADLLVGAAPVVVQVALEKAAHGAVIPRAVLEALGGAGGLVEVATRIHLALSVRRAGARGVLGVADAR
mmetsp:Transcript_21138/g.48939  ORF Transcript_21138/g.48939 Transcript_21138/m.48939 type:complete len:644 (-) Transcript_21138:3172-5103(-)